MTEEEPVTFDVTQNGQLLISVCGDPEWAWGEVWRYVHSTMMKGDRFSIECSDPDVKERLIKKNRSH